MIFKRFFILFLVVAFFGTFAPACEEDGDSGFSNFFPFLIVYFISNRTSPQNNAGDGDIFYLDLASPSSVTNVTDGEGTGDSEDYACASDLSSGRSRLFFVSERTDVGNPQGDIDVFMVPSLGGTIVNLTDSVTEADDRDDLCLGVVPSSGALVFESVRTDYGNDAGDGDLFVAELTIDEFGSVTGASITNRTEEKDGSSEVTDRLVWIGNSGSLFFESERDETDDTPANENGPFENTDEDQHIFSVPSSGAVVIRNLTHDNDENDARTMAKSDDVFCGLNSGETILAFHSTRNQGSMDGSGVQIDIGGDDEAAQDIFIRNLVLNQTFTLVNPSVNSAMENLTDAGALGDGTEPGDHADYCNFGFGWNAFTSVLDSDRIFFASMRTGAGTHRVDGTGGATTFSDVTNHPDQIPGADRDTDLFHTNVVLSPSGGVLNEVTNLTDAAVVMSTGDNVDTKLGLCGTSVIFASTRTDRAVGSSGAEDDLFAVSLESGVITNLTDSFSSGDDNDVFLCCNSQNDRVAFASQRTDTGNSDGDVDIFSIALSNSPGLITNMTDAASGDDRDDVFDSVNFAFGDLSTTGIHSESGGPFATTTLLTTGLPSVPADALDAPGVGGEGYGYGVSASTFPVFCSSNDQIIFMSTRGEPFNSGGNMDLFAIPFFGNDGLIGNTDDMINLTDTGNTSTDGEDGLTAVGDFAIPNAIF